MLFWKLEQWIEREFVHLEQGWRTYLLSRATLSVTAEQAGRTTF